MRQAESAPMESPNTGEYSARIEELAFIDRMASARSAPVPYACSREPGIARTIPATIRTQTGSMTRSRRRASLNRTPVPES
ncbi:hypothetical protein GCM10009837_71680 [Streptomyces durmitorensis]